MRTDSGTEASGIITYPPEYLTGMTNIGLWPSSHEHFTNSTCATANITGFESVRSDLVSEIGRCINFIKSGLIDKFVPELQDIILPCNRRAKSLPIHSGLNSL